MGFSIRVTRRASVLLPQPELADDGQGAALVEGEADPAQGLDLARRLEQPAADDIAPLEALGGDDAGGPGHAASPLRPGWSSGTPPVSG